MPHRGNSGAFEIQNGTSINMFSLSIIVRSESIGYAVINEGELVLKDVELNDSPGTSSEGSHMIHNTSVGELIIEGEVKFQKD